MDSVDKCSDLLDQMMRCMYPKKKKPLMLRSGIIRNPDFSINCLPVIREFIKCDSGNIRSS